MSKGESMTNAWNKKLQLRDAQINQQSHSFYSSNNSIPTSNPYTNKSNTSSTNGKSNNIRSIQSPSSKLKSNNSSSSTSTASTLSNTSNNSTAISNNNSSNSTQSDTDSLLRIYTSLRGTLVLIQTVDKSVYEGLFHTIEFNNNTSVVVLQQCQLLMDQVNSKPQFSTALTDIKQTNTYHDIQRISFNDIVQMKSFNSPFIIDPQTNKPNGTPGDKNKSFMTDTQISNKSTTRQRELQQYDFSIGSTGTGTTITPATYHSLDDEIRANNGQSFDQFQRFQQMTGKTNNFDLNDYSTHLDKSSELYKSNEYRANKLAREIESQKSYNIHEQIERNQRPDVDVDEESLHSTVVRTNDGNNNTSEIKSNTYQPPHARKSVGNNTVNNNNKPNKQTTSNKQKTDTTSNTSTAATTTASNSNDSAPTTTTATTNTTQPATTKSPSPQPLKSDDTTIHTTTEQLTQSISASVTSISPTISADDASTTAAEPTTTTPPASAPAATPAPTTDSTADTQQSETKKQFKFNVKAKEFVFGGSTDVTSNISPTPHIPTNTSINHSIPHIHPPSSYDPSAMYMQPDLQLYLQQQQLLSAHQLPIDPLTMQPYIIPRSNVPPYDTRTLSQQQSYYNSLSQPQLNNQLPPQYYGTIPQQYPQQPYQSNLQYIQLPYPSIPQYQNNTYMNMPMGVHAPQPYTPSPGRGGRGGRGRGGGNYFNQTNTQ